MNSIKLVIWDLDGTFWQGTISEEGIKVIAENIDILKILIGRGIMNSIVSKNNFEQVKSKLIELGIWEYFIFPKIEWSPKGQLVAQIIKDSQLREENVLFIDDNHLNREEVKFYNPNINIRDELFIPLMLQHNAFEGKEDKDYSRLKQYKILENKLLEQKLFADNNEFLKASNIKVSLSRVLSCDIDRVYELIHRTNQLNFTKIRINKNELIEAINNKNIITKKINVWDKFGNYGVVGFIALDVINNEFIHFLFSCRIINLGIEQYIYTKYNCPKITVVGDVVTTLSNHFIPDWIEEVMNENSNVIDVPTELKLKNQLNILLKGGCDLEQMIHYVDKTIHDFLLEFNGVNCNNIPLHKEHTTYIMNSMENKYYHKNKDILDEIPFIDETFYHTDLFNDNNDILVYSLLMDYTQILYEHKTTKVKIAYGGYKNDLINDKEYVLTHKTYFDNGFIYKFSQEYDYLGPISVTEFKNNLNRIINAIGNKPIIFINGAEVKVNNDLEPDAYFRHKIMNMALDDIVSNHTNTYLLDMRKIITDSSMLTHNLRHYKREVYEIMAKELTKLINNIIPS